MPCLSWPPWWQRRRITYQSSGIKAATATTASPPQQLQQQSWPWSCYAWHGPSEQRQEPQPCGHGTSGTVFSTYVSEYYDKATVTFPTTSLDGVATGTTLPRTSQLVEMQPSSTQLTDLTQQSRQSDNGTWPTSAQKLGLPDDDGAIPWTDQLSYKDRERTFSAHDNDKHIIDEDTISCTLSADRTEEAADQDSSTFSTDPETESTTSSHWNHEQGNDSDYEQDHEEPSEAPTLSGLSFYDFIARILKNFPRRARHDRNARRTEAVTHHDKCGSDPAHALCTPSQRRQKVYKGKNWQPMELLPVVQDLTHRDDDIAAEARSERQHQRRRRIYEFNQRWELARPRRTSTAKGNSSSGNPSRPAGQNQNNYEHPTSIAGPTTHEELQRAQLKAAHQGRGYGASYDWMQQQITDFNIQNAITINADNDAPSNRKQVIQHIQAALARSDRLDPRAKQGEGMRVAVLTKGHWSLVHIGVQGWTHFDPLSRSQAGYARHEHLEEYFGVWINPRFMSTTKRDNPVRTLRATMAHAEKVRQESPGHHPRRHNPIKGDAGRKRPNAKRSFRSLRRHPGTV